MKYVGRRCITILMLMAFLIFGCSPLTVKMKEETRHSLKNLPEVKAIHYQTSDIILPCDQPISAGTIYLRQSCGDVLQNAKRNGLKNPAGQMKKRFVSHLKNVLGFTNVNIIEGPMREIELDELGKRFPEDTLLDFETRKWAVPTARFQGYHYISLVGRGRIVQFPGGKILWQGICDVEDKEPERLPLYEEFLANDGKILIEKLDGLSNKCVKQLIDQFEGKGAGH